MMKKKEKVDEREKRNASAKEDEGKTIGGRREGKMIKGPRTADKQEASVHDEKDAESGREGKERRKKGGHLLNVTSLHDDSVLPKATKDIN